MLKDIDHFLDSFITVVIASIPIFLVAVSFWSKGFDVVIGGTLRTYYLTPAIMQNFVNQIGLSVGSLVFGLLSRIFDDAGWKKILFGVSLFSYLISMLFFLLWVSGMSTFA